MSPRATIGVLALLVATGTAAGQGLLGAQGYPEPSCGARPEPPSRPEAFPTVEALARYNAAVDVYNGAMEGWVDCLQRYVDDAAADIELIRGRIEEALATANRR